MAMTTSIAFPNMFDAARNRVAVLEDRASVTNRCKLLFLTEPTELYHNLNQGVGLKQHLWKYNNENVSAIIKDTIIEQLRLHEPCSIPESTSFADGLLFTGEDETGPESYNKLELTVGIETTFGTKAEVSIFNE